MRRALSEAAEERLHEALFEELVTWAAGCRFDVAPEPCEAAAVVAAGGVVARARREFYGGAQPWLAALAGGAGGDTLVTTLEPRVDADGALLGADLLAASAIRQVVVGSLEPDLRQRGRGVAALRALGLTVDVAEWGAPLHRVAPHYLNWRSVERARRPRPWTIAKWAQTRSGQLTPPEDVGDGRWISCTSSQDEVQVLRGRVDAVVTGIGTGLADDPRLSVRPPGEVERAPLRVVLDSKLRTPPESRLLAQTPDDMSEAAGAVCILGVAGAPASRFRALVERGAEVHLLPPDWHGRLSLEQASRWLWERGLRRILVEAGPRILSAFLKAGAVDQVRIYTGDVMGGRGSRVEGVPSESTMSGVLHRECGDDAVLEGFTRRF